MLTWRDVNAGVHWLRSSFHACFFFSPWISNMLEGSRTRGGRDSILTSTLLRGKTHYPEQESQTHTVTTTWVNTKVPPCVFMNAWMDMSWHAEHPRLRATAWGGHVWLWRSQRPVSGKLMPGGHPEVTLKGFCARFIWLNFTPLLVRVPYSWLNTFYKRAAKSWFIYCTCHSIDSRSKELKKKKKH